MTEQIEIQMNTNMDAVQRCWRKGGKELESMRMDQLVDYNLTAFLGILLYERKNATNRTGNGVMSCSCRVLGD